ncbi:MULTISPECIES: helix-turn-helix transcriptional regulator [Halobacteriales]|uniref:MarR family transcriptional regulator n=1 Tax=Halosegnis rubeus TaxID=2212850 RepID=A0A5N5U6L2_9EURY|nr:MULTISPECIES: MarR family transcriptional regulator [Halobacteriales]KAB7513541.1 MarR family transcriptional regulator [Halosegnis rubeus]
MNRRRADTVVGVLLGFVLLAGGVLSWRAYQQRRAIEQSMGSMMGSSMGTMHGPDPLWYVVGTLLVAGVIGGVYYVVRGELTDPEVADTTVPVDPAQTSAATATSMDDDAAPATSINPESDPQARVLDLLPDDERRVLEPVLNSPGITQIELRDRSEFSKSKVSQTVSSLEERGLLYRERQGRTYRVYPSDDLRQQQPGK